MFLKYKKIKLSLINFAITNGPCKKNHNTTNSQAIDFC
jgi:hypothetical protein